MKNIITELQWRDLIANHTDLLALQKDLTDSAGHIFTVYLGIDPTAPSLHAGHLVPLLTLRRFQLAGYRPILVLGGASAQIGDPREVGERKLQSENIVASYEKNIEVQLNKLFDFNQEVNSAVIVNNKNWIYDLSAISLLRDVGKYFSLNVMLSKDLVKKRLANDGISFTEFSYTLLQAYDYLHLYRKEKCKLQIGGADQWGNLVSGVDYIRKVTGSNIHALTVPLVTNSDGTKFGKSTGGGNLWLDALLTSPYSWYQYFINVSDADVIKFIKWFTFLTKSEVDKLQTETETAPHLRGAQITLARELTNLIHGEKVTQAVEQASQALFGKADLEMLNTDILAAALQEAGVVDFPKHNLENFNLIEQLVESGLAESKSKAKNLLLAGGIYINNNQISELEWRPKVTDFIFDTWLVIRRGKKYFAGIKLV